MTLGCHVTLSKLCENFLNPCTFRIFAYFSIHILSSVRLRPYSPNIPHRVYYSPTNAQVIVLKAILKFTLK